MKFIVDDVRQVELPYPSMTEDEFFAFCAANPDTPMERDRHGNILLMEPAGAESGAYEGDAITQLGMWNWRTRAGKTFSSNAGFTLPNGAVRAPDAAWIKKERWQAVPDYDKARFAHITPDFVLEIRSPSDSLRELHSKMDEWLEAGVRLAFLIDPVEQRAWSYRPERQPFETADFSGAMSGEDVLPGFALPLELFAG